MDFTREPIIESIITPKEGCKLVVRSSKGTGIEEYFLDAVEIVSFGGTFFLRSLERPKCFLLPATDYEVVEVREPRMVLKSPGLERSAKQAPEKPAQKQSKKEEETKPAERKKERRKHQKKKRSQDEAVQPEAHKEPKQDYQEQPAPRPENTIIPPPSTLISETIARYRGDDLFKGVFFPEPEDEIVAVIEQHLQKDLEDNEKNT